MEAKRSEYIERRTETCNTVSSEDGEMWHKEIQEQKRSSNTRRAEKGGQKTFRTKSNEDQGSKRPMKKQRGDRVWRDGCQRISERRTQDRTGQSVVCPWSLVARMECGRVGGNFW